MKQKLFYEVYANKQHKKRGDLHLPPCDWSKPKGTEKVSTCQNSTFSSNKTLNKIKCVRNALQQSRNHNCQTHI